MMRGPRLDDRVILSLYARKPVVFYLFIFAFVQWKVEFTQVCKTYVAGESPLQQETEQGFFRPA